MGKIVPVAPPTLALDNRFLLLVSGSYYQHLAERGCERMISYNEPREKKRWEEWQERTGENEEYYIQSKIIHEITSKQGIRKTARKEDAHINLHQRNERSNDHKDNHKIHPLRLTSAGAKGDATGCRLKTGNAKKGKWKDWGWEWDWTEDEKNNEVKPHIKLRKTRERKWEQGVWG